MKAHFSQVIDSVAGMHERVTVTKNGSPVAVILAVEDYESPRGDAGDSLRPEGDGRATASGVDMRQSESYDEEQLRAALAARRS